MVIVEAHEVDAFFPMTLTFSDGTLLDRQGIHEDAQHFYVTYSQHDGQQWHHLTFFVPKRSRERCFPWTPEKWADEIRKAEQYDRDRRELRARHPGFGEVVA